MLSKPVRTGAWHLTKQAVYIYFGIQPGLGWNLPNATAEGLECILVIEG
jgi:hypothetical protein